MGRYEVQILDSFENPTYFDGPAGAMALRTSDTPRDYSRTFQRVNVVVAGLMSAGA